MTPMSSGRWKSYIGISIVLLSAGASVAAVARVDRAVAHETWNPRTAAAYLDARMTWWLGWPTAARDHNTACVSCHTAVPYALSRSSLRSALSETDAAAPERQMLDNVVKRVRLWREVEPFYPDQTRGLPKSSESRGTESVLNALILSRRDARAGTLSDDARQAFANMWALQFRNGDLKGAWAWLNFHNEPWEANSSAYLGAALAAIAVGSAPDGYAATPEIQDGVKQLSAFLQRGADTTSFLNRAIALWASAALPAALTSPQRQAIADSLLAKQQSDGGWSLSTLGPYKRADGTVLDASSDGYATGIATLALQSIGTASTEAAVKKSRDWLATHQDPSTGRWPASSLNKTRDPSTDIGKFMSDASTAFAVLALTSRSVR